MRLERGPRRYNITRTKDHIREVDPPHQSGLRGGDPLQLFLSPMNQDILKAISILVRKYGDGAYAISRSSR